MQWSSLVWISLLSPPLVWWSNLSLFSKFYCWIGVNSRTYTGGEKWYNAENVHYARGMLNMIGVTTKSQLTHCFRNIFSKISTPALTGKYRGVLSSAFNQLKYLFTAILLVLSLNAGAVEDAEKFNKKAYLDLSKPYTYNWNNSPSYTKKDNQATLFLKEAGSTLRGTIGSTNSNNTNKLGSKITTGLENQLKNKAINTTEGLINDKANKFVNQFGSGRSEISIHNIKSENPTYSIKTIQPLSKLDSESKDLTFFQGQLASGENHGERRNTINLGVGHRFLIEEGAAMAGINLFSDYEIKSGHKRLSLGLEYQRSNFSTHINSYYPMSHRRNIGDYTEEALAGYDLKLIGQVPYLPWAKIKGTRYHWDGKQGPDVKGTIFGVAVELTSSIGVEFGTEKSNTADKASYMHLTTQLPFKDNESFTNFSIDSKPFRNTGIVNLTDLSPVERSNKIRIEKVSRTSAVVLGVYNATTKDARCTLYNASGVAVARGSGTTTNDGSVSFPRVILSTTSSLYYSICKGGSYTDEATGNKVTAPTLHSAAMYSGTGNLVLIASPLSEIAYQMADNATGSLSDFAKVIEEKNDNVATTFGLDNIDVITTFPTDLTKTAAQNDNAGRFGLILSAISQMGKDLRTKSPGDTIAALVRDINGTDGSHPNTIEGRKHKSGSETVDLLVAIDNFEKGGMPWKNNTGEAGSAKGEDSVRGKLAIVKISLYDGNNNMPTVKDYTAYADVTGVNNLVEVSLKIAAATQADSDTRSEIQTLVNDAPGLAAAKKSTLEASSYSVNTDGTTTSTITMQAKDATTNSKNLTTGGLTVTMSVNGSATLSSVSDNADGTYTATITNNTVETVRVSAAFDGSDVGNVVDVSFTFTSKTIKFNKLDYITMKSPRTGRIWLDRNLGATQTQVTSSTNSAAYGDIYQWGRGNKDKHKSRGSGTISTRLASITALDDRFIVNNETPDDWTTNRAVDDNGEDRMAAWADGGANDICPPGFSVPTEAELAADVWDIDGTATALSSFLRIPTAGFRGHIYGALGNVGADANLWTRSAKGSKSGSFHMYSGSAHFNDAVRTMGFSVRCIQG